VIHRSTVRIATGVCLVLGSCRMADAQTFAPGDIYQLTTQWPDPAPNTARRAIVRWRPGTEWSSTVIADIGLEVRGAYDAFRDRIIVPENPGDTDRLLLFDAAGGQTSIGTGVEFVLTSVAPAGDGPVYFTSQGVNRIWYLDAGDAVQDLLDTDGMTPFVLSGVGIKDLLYYGPTNSLYCTQEVDVLTNDLRIVRIPLAPGGGQLAAAPSMAAVEVENAAGTISEGLSAGPNGSLFLKVDDNSNAAVPRMKLIEPLTLASSTYATSSYTGVAGEKGGVYVPWLSAAIVVDTSNDVLRSFAFGEVGAGTVVASGVSTDSGSGDAVRLLVIPGALCPGDADGDGSVGFSDITEVLDNWLSDYGPGTGPGDANGDGLVNFGDITVVLENWLAVCP